MEKTFVHIKSKIPADISINGESVLGDNIDLMTTRDFYITFFPKTITQYLPCATKFYGNIHPQSIIKIPYKNNHYDIIFNPAAIPNSKDETTILNKKYNNTLININNSHKSFISISSPGFNHLSTSELINNVKLKAIDGYCILSGKISNSKDYLMIFNSKKNILLLENTFDKVEFSSGQIKAMKNNNSISGYGKVYEFSFASKKLSSYSIYLHKTIKSFSTPELIPYAFLESIKYGDFKTAKKYLNDDNIDSEQIKNFFGEIQEIHFNPYSQDINYTIKSNSFKSFTFSIDNGKIAEIEENQLNIL